MSIDHHKRAYWAGIMTGAVAMALAACGPTEADQTPPTGDIATADVTPTPTQTPALDSDVEADAGSDAKPEEKAGDEAKQEPSSTASFPAKFQGRWAINAADCTKARGMETTVMTIDAKSAQFYESMATLKSATLNGDAVTATLGWMGEGETWESDTVFTLKDGGSALTRKDAKDGTARSYTKCPA